MMPGQMMWIDLPHQPPRLLLGRESMLIQGYPIAQVSKMVNSTPEILMASIGGSMMASPVALAIMQALFAVLPWNDQRTSVGDATELKAAMDVFSSITALPEEEAPQKIEEHGAKKKRRLFVGMQWHA